MGAHGAVASLALGSDITHAVLDDFESAPIDEKLRATLRFLKKLTLEPDALDADDARAVKAAGVSRQALHDALMVAFCFNMITRIADSLGWVLPDREGLDASAKFLLAKGYRMPFRGRSPADD
jgi:alkylhydroperoxidase family enzyme